MTSIPPYKQPEGEIRFEWKKTSLFGREQLRIKTVKKEGKQISEIHVVSQNLLPRLGRFLTKSSKFKIHTVVIGRLADNKITIYDDKKTRTFRSIEKLREKEDKVLTQLLEKIENITKFKDEDVKSYKPLLLSQVKTVKDSLDQSNSFIQLHQKLQDIGHLQSEFRDLKRLAKYGKVEIAEVPDHGIKVGLPNIQGRFLFGNTCWLNSTLKFISCTTHYDSMLSGPVPENKKLLQIKLRMIVNKLREGKEINKDEYLSLLKEIKSSIGKFKKLGVQEDATEFLQNLTEALNWPPLDKKSENFPMFATAYYSQNPSYVKYGGENEFAERIDIGVPYGTQEEELDLSKLIDEPTELEVRPDKVANEYEKVPDDDKKVSKESEKAKKSEIFTQDKFVTNFPEELIINIKRMATPVLTVKETKFFQRPEIKKRFDILPGLLATQLTRITEIHVFKINTPIHQEEGQIVLTEYAPLKDREGHIIGKIPTYKCYYQIAATLKHGGSSGQGGHYVCEERTKSGKLQEHSDLHITEKDSEHFGVNGYILRLHRVKREKIPESNL